MRELTATQERAYETLDRLGLAAMKNIPTDVFDAMYDTLDAYGVNFDNVEVRRAFHALGKHLADIANMTADEVGGDYPQGELDAVTGALSKISMSLVACAGYAASKSQKG